MSQESFIESINNGYKVNGVHFPIGVAKYRGAPIADCKINVPVKMLNRHGLIAGATGTGKTKTLQIVAEGLSKSGVPVMLMDIKGDLSGMAASGELNGFIEKRYTEMGYTYEPTLFPVELLTISQEKGTKLKATVIEFGPVLFSRILDLNDTQSGIMSVLFKFSEDQALPLLDLKDVIKLIQYATEEGKASIEKSYGKLSSASLGTILRKVIELQQQGGDLFFGERSFDPVDLMRYDARGYGMVNILRLVDIQDKPKLFSAFMLQLLAELYSTLPEVGDMDKPKLVIFIDEAHLIFKEASKVLLEQIETIVKLIRSKGVGIIFCTQNPTDIPDGVLGQLGLKIQHALRAFTAKDRKGIKQTAENYPFSDYYKTEELLTQIGTAEAMITMLNEKGAPSPLVHLYLTSPQSRMDILNSQEIDQLVSQSKLAPIYNQDIDRESAHEILTKRIEMILAEQEAEKQAKIAEKRTSAATTTTNGRVGRPKQEKSFLETAMNSAAGKQIQRSLVRTLFGVVQKMFK